MQVRAGIKGVLRENVFISMDRSFLEGTSWDEKKKTNVMIQTEASVCISHGPGR